jgi:peptidoglycan/xylan/chitin deacetylase (PgdA/CDA1 family)
VSFVASFVKRSLHRLGWYRRRLQKDEFPGPVVLCYHNVLPAGGGGLDHEIPFRPLQVTARRLEEHCKAIAETCQPIALNRFAAGFTDREPWPKRPVLVTFDDGYRNLLDVAAPIMERHGIPGVVFACTESFPDGGFLWTDRVGSMAGDAEVERLKNVPDAERRAVANDAGPPNDQCRLMNAAELKALAERFGWAIGGHSHTHPILARCTLDVQTAEIENNLQCLERLLGARPTTFAYPNGRPGRDYDDATRTLLKQAGVGMAFTTESGFVIDRSRPFDVPRMLMTDGVTGSELLHRLAVSWRR